MKSDSSIDTYQQNLLVFAIPEGWVSKEPQALALEGLKNHKRLSLC